MLLMLKIILNKELKPPILNARILIMKIQIQGIITIPVPINAHNTAFSLNTYNR